MNTADKSAVGMRPAARMAVGRTVVGEEATGKSDAGRWAVDSRWSFHSMQL